MANLFKLTSNISSANQLYSCLKMAMAAFVLTQSGCARNHYYIEPNGQVTAVGHQPLFGTSHIPAQQVQVAEVPTQIQGAKIVSSAPQTNTIGGGSVSVGVVNPAIPEAVVVQQPSNGGSVNEPGLIGADASNTQLSGGIKSAAKPTEGLLD